MALRIITGELKGREVWTPKGAKFRPSTHFLREMLFSLIGPDAIHDCVFLDVFAGSGIVGFEAISRGAKKAIFLEKAYRQANGIRQNAERMGVSERACILKIDATRDLDRLSHVLSPTEHISLVFIDPPFNRPVEIPFLKAMVLHREFFADDVRIFLETRFAPKEIPDGYEVADQRKTSSSVLTTLGFTER